MTENNAIVTTPEPGYPPRELGRVRPKYAGRVAKALWEAEGRPEATEPGEAGRLTYESMADMVLAILPTLGLKVVRDDS